MVRKQLYISEEHERALKARSRELGLSEAELVRRMLDGLLPGEGGEGRGASLWGPADPRSSEALEAFFGGADRLAAAHRFPQSYRFDREELYEDRA